MPPSRAEYSQALTFDQKLALMKKGEFPGFREAPIDFPPTFKCDVDSGDKFKRNAVRRAIKKFSKERHALREWRKSSNQSASRNDVCTVVEECEIEASAVLELEAKIEGKGDQTSLASTALAALFCNEDAESRLSSDDDEGGVDDENTPLATAVAENTAKNARREGEGQMVFIPCEREG